MTSLAALMSLAGDHSEISFLVITGLIFLIVVVAKRQWLDRLFNVSGYVAAFFLAAIAGLIVAQIVGRFVAVAIDAIEVSGFCMAASTFFGLAATLRRGTHIRVNLLLRGLRGRSKRAFELWCTGAGAIAMSYFATQAVLMVYDTFRFGEVTKGLIIMDLWIPQAAMAAGVAVLAVALADEFMAALRGAELSYESADPMSHLEEQM
jgi:TRAP-type C4-dicarboxylate transport system permease small subunit